MSTNEPYYIIEQYDTYQKMSYNNRCIISGSNGLITLTVPIVNGREQKALNRDVKIDGSQPWQKQHWRAIQSSYSRAPFFEYFGADVQKLVFKDHQYLFDLNLEIIDWLQQKLKLPASYQLSTAYSKNYDRNAIIDYRNSFVPKNRIETAAGSKPYTQVFEDKFGFIPGLSVIDILFCKGSL